MWPQKFEKTWNKLELIYHVSDEEASVVQQKELSWMSCFVASKLRGYRGQESHGFERGDRNTTDLFSPEGHLESK